MAASNQSQSERGFAAMDPERQRDIAGESSKACHQSRNAHEFSSEEARRASRKGDHARVGNKVWNQGASR